MPKQTLSILAFIFVVLLIVASRPMWSEFVPQFNSQNTQQQIELAALADQLTKITVHKTDQPIVLEKKDGLWTVDGFPIDQEKSAKLISETKNLKVDSLVSTNPDKFAIYDATPSAGIRVSFDTPSKQLTYIIGKSAPQGQSYYLKPESENKVFLVPGTLRGLIQGTQDDWRDKTLVNLPEDQLSKIEITENGTTISITKDAEAKWQAVMGSRSTIVGETMADRFMSAFDPLQAQGFAKEENRQSFINTNRKSSVVVYNAANEVALDLQLIKKDAIWLAQPKNSSEIFILNDSVVSSFLLKSSDVFVGN